MRQGWGVTRTCSVCAAVLPEGASFCPRCGAFASQPAAGERRLVSVLFADLVGSTDLGRRLDAERAREVLGAFYDAASAEVSSGRGRVEKFVGDAVMAVFGLPRTHEDDAVRAARAGLGIRDRVERLSVRLALDPPLRVRVGVEAGEAVTGEGPPGQQLVTGTVVNAAARLQAAARPGEVLVGTTAQRLVGDAATFDSERSLRAQGFPGGLRARPLLALGRRSVRRTIPLVGREPELSLLRLMLDRAARTRRPHLVTVVADAGMGKSRLVDELVAVVAGDALCMVGRADAFGGANALAPAAEMVRRFAGAGDDVDPGGLAEVVAASLAARGLSVPTELAGGARYLAGGSPRAGEEEVTLVEDAQRLVARLLALLSADSRVVVVVDDLHAARGPMVDLVQRLVGRRASPGRLLVVATARPDLLSERPDWAGAGINQALIHLEPLAEVEATDLALQASAGRLDEPGARRIAGRAGGNPFFIIESTAMLLDAPGDADPDALPPTVQAVVAARLDNLVAPLRELVGRAAIFMDSFDLEELALVSDADRAALQDLEDAEILVGEGRPRRWRFAHRILHDVAYAGVSKRERLRLHLAVADGLAARGVYGNADHLERAAAASLDVDPSDRAVPDRAVDALLEAGDRARRRMESRRAVERYGRALALAGDPERWGAREARALAGIGEARYWLSDFPGASEALARAEQLGLQSGDDEALAVALRFLGEIVLNVDTDTARAEELHARSLQAAERLGDPRLIARSLLFAAWVPWTREDFATAEATWRRALELARETGDRWVEARALIAISVARSELEDLTSAGDLVGEALRVARDLGDEFSTAVAMVQLGRTLLERGEPAEALPMLTEAAGIFADLGARWELADAHYARGRAYEGLERLEEAENDLRLAVRLSEELGARALAGWTSGALRRVRSRRRDAGTVPAGGAASPG